MAKTAAQRQAAYRTRRPHAGNDGNGERRLSVWIDTGASLVRIPVNVTANSGAT